MRGRPRHPPPLAPDAAARSAISARAAALGFDAVGFARPSLSAETREHLVEFLAAGRHGEMGWLAARSAQRAAPSALWPEVRSVIALGLSYAPAGDALATLAQPACGNLSVYARHRDYHDIIKGKLKHLAQFIVSHLGGAVKVFVDTAPVMEKPLAHHAGLGWQGKHSNLVSRRHGSWLLLGEIFSTLDLGDSSPHADRCGRCSRCLDICPTVAFPAPYQLDARRCISYLTIEHHGPVDVELREKLGNRIFGCDDCLAVCPWNRFAQAGREAKLHARAALMAPALRDLAALDDAAFRALFAASPVKRIGRNRFLRNVLYAIGNSAQADLLPAAAACLNEADPVVADAARWAVSRLTALSA